MMRTVGSLFYDTMRYNTGTIRYDTKSISFRERGYEQQTLLSQITNSEDDINICIKKFIKNKVLPSSLNILNIQFV